VKKRKEKSNEKRVEINGGILLRISAQYWYRLMLGLGVKEDKLSAL